MKRCRKPIALAVLGFLSFHASGQQLEIVYEGETAKGVRCVGCSDEITVRLTDATSDMMGRVEHSQGSTTFYGALPFDSDLAYEVWDADQMIGTFQPRAVCYSSTSIAAIFPQSELLPANLLKMQVVFSAPMSVGDSYQYIHFYRENKELTPLLQLQPELWNEDRTILTLWLDPGRIKRDLLRQKELGTPLVKDQEYLMVIDSNWRDSHGNRLSSHAIKRFRTSAPDRIMPSVGSWRLGFPEKPDDPLIITFDEPMDYLLLLEAIHVDDGQSSVGGTVFISEGQRQWQFEPQEPWAHQINYQLTVESRMEDLAGNNLYRPFDRDIKQSESEQPRDVTYTFQLPRR